MFKQWWQTNVDVQQQRDIYFATGRNDSWNPSSSAAGAVPIFRDNPYWTRYENYQNDERNDPRLPLYFDAVEGEFVGAEIGATAPYSTTSKLTERFHTPTEPGILFDYSEVEFLIAEAAAREYSVGDVETHNNAGITASIRYWGGTQAQADAYLAQANVAYDSAIATSDAATPRKEVIGTQKWIALFNRGMEAWTSIRLLDYPEMATPVDAITGYPTRYTYPIVEQTINAASWSAAADAIGGDLAETMLFWDLN